MSSVKVFTLRQRKGDERDILKIQKVDVPSEVSDDGARLVAVSPDLRWLSIVRPNSEIYLAKMSPSSGKEKPQIHPKLIKVERAPRHNRHEKASHGTLGNYERTIRSIVFSDDSKILASGDLSGCVDVWVLEDVSPSSPNVARKPNGVASSDDEESSDDEDEQPIIDGQRWKPSPSESPIPRLPAGIVFLSFRPRRPTNSKALTNGTHGPAEDRLMVLTSEHQLVEFEALKGSFSDWSRRNPKAYLPAEFTGVKDRAMGGIWDITEDHERIWLYGTSWLWMFDLTHDFPSPDAAAAADGQQNDQKSGQLVKASSSQKRKRELVEDDDDREERRKYNSGAGDKIPLSQVDVSLGTKMRKIVGNDESKEEWVQVEKQRQNAKDEQEEEGEDEFEHGGGNPFFVNDESNFARLRRDNNPDSEEATSTTTTPQKKRLTNGVSHADIFPHDDDGPSFAVVVDNTGHSEDRTPKKDKEKETEKEQKDETTTDAEPSKNNNQPRRQWWHTYKYRDIFGIVPLGHSSPEAAKEKEERNLLEVAVVERPVWDMDLPGRYVRDYE